MVVGRCGLPWLADCTVFRLECVVHQVLAGYAFVFHPLFSLLGWLKKEAVCMGVSVEDSVL